VRSPVVSRIVLPIVLPIAVLLAIATFVGAVAITLLYNTKGGSLMLAAVAAGGILFTVALAASQDRLSVPKRGIVLFAAALPLLVGGAIGLGLIGDVDDADRMANVQPLLVVPDDAPVIAAENSLEFCIGPEGACDPVTDWDVVPSAETESLVFLFDNREVGVQHNVVITDLGDGVDDPAPGQTVFASSTLVAGPALDAYVSQDVTWAELPEEWYFFCAIHPNMNGVGRVVEG
jgi:hypothetical protein